MGSGGCPELSSQTIALGEGVSVAEALRLVSSVLHVALLQAQHFTASYCGTIHAGDSDSVVAVLVKVC